MPRPDPLEHFHALSHQQGTRASDTVIDGYRHRGPAQPAWRVAIVLTAAAEFAHLGDATIGYEAALEEKAAGAFGPHARVELERWLPEARVWLPCVWAAAPSEADQ